LRVKSKVKLIVIICIVMTVTITTSIIRIVMIDYIQKQENLKAGEDYKRTDTILQKEEASLESLILDWSEWDDTYQFIQDRNEKYIDSNLQDSTLETLKLNFMLFVDNQGNIIFQKVLNWESQNNNKLVQELEKSLKLKEDSKWINSISKCVTGTLMILGKPVLISFSPVTSSDQKAPNNGILVMGKIINQEFVNYLEEVLQLNIKIEDTKSIELNTISKQDYQKLLINGSTIVTGRNENELKSISGISNIYGQTDIFLVLSSQREAYKKGLAAVLYFGIFFFTAFGIIGVICVTVVDKLLINRLKIIYNFMNKVGNSKNTKARIYLPGNDEISRLAANTNVMLEEIDKHYSEIKIIEERYKLIMEATNDGYFDANIPKNQIYISPIWLSDIGYEESDVIHFDRLIELLHSEDKDLFLSCLEKCLTCELEHLRVEFRMCKKTGEWIWIEARGKIVEFDQSINPIRFIGTISDITNRKKYEEENIYLSQSDVTTTLKNRAYMENILKKADECDECNSWIIMGDVNGLKLINDTFGHQDGDRLLRVVGEILKKCCANDDIPARWGGDEFIIFMKDKDEVYIKNLISNIKKECEEVTDYPIKISIALGRAQKDKKHKDMDSVLKLAEERMYRNKLLESRSARSSILSSLEQSLHEKSIETVEHTKRIKQICILIGNRMGLTQDELDELALLGSLHDIGKIGIPEDILLKPGKLTNDEWEIMKTHSEIGYRIAGATHELIHIADEILYHHERYDGTGYPQGLKGADIPKLSRLISIVDSFDVMTHDRHYKKAMDINQVVQELKDCSGKQFDPEMIDSFLALLDENLIDNIVFSDSEIRL